MNLTIFYFLAPNLNPDMKQMHKHDSAYKQFLAIKREENLLRDLKRSQPYLTVEPFLNGWICDVQIKPQYLTQAGLKEAIDIGYSIKFVSSLKDVKQIRRGVTDYRIRNIFVSYFPAMKQISTKDYDKLDTNLQQYFTLKSRDQEYNVTRDLKKQRLFYQIDVKKNWIKLRVKPNICTKIKQIIPYIESRLQEIRELYEQNMYWVRYHRSGKRDFNINLRQDFKNQLHKYKLEQIDTIENNRFKLGWS